MTKMFPKLSLSYICTVKNGERYVEEALRSIFSADPGCEVVIVDDGSTDSTVRVVRSLEVLYPRLKIVKTGGIGRGAALNRAWRLAGSEFIANLDSDDLALPGRARLANWLSAAGERYAACVGGAVTWNGVGAPPSAFGSENPKFHDISECLHRFNPVSHAAVVIRKSALCRVGGYAEDRSSQFDYDLWVRLVAAGFRIAKNPTPVASKRIHNEQSFEANRHFRYVLSSVLVQRRAAHGWKQGMEWLFFATARLAWGVLPSGVRINVRTKDSPSKE